MLDVIDEQLIQILGENARQGSEELAIKLNVSATTVRRRLNRLINEGIIRIAAVVDPEKVGLPLRAIISLNVAHRDMDAALKIIAKRQEVKWVSTTTGRFNIMISTRFRSATDLSSFLHKELAQIEGLKESDTAICLHIEKGQYMRV